MKLARNFALSSLALAFASFSYAADPIKIGVDGPFTGGSSSMGVSMRDGVRLAVSEINKAGGVLGRQIVLVERDDEAANARGVQIAQELINKEKVVAAVGYINTGVALASQRFFQDAKIPVMNNVATGSVVTHQFDDQAENYIFRNAVLEYANGGDARLMAANREHLLEAYPPQTFAALMLARYSGPHSSRSASSQARPKSPSSFWRSAAICSSIL